MFTKSWLLDNPFIHNIADLYDFTAGSIRTSRAQVFAVGYFLLLHTSWLQFKVGTRGKPSGGSVSVPVVNASMSLDLIRDW